MNQPKMPKRLGKKAEDMLVDFWAILIFAIIVIIMFIVFYATKHQTNMETVDDFKNKDAAFMLDSFLRSPYLADRHKTMSEIIAEDAVSKNFTRTENSFYYYYSGLDIYSGTFDGDYYLPKKIESVTLCVDNPNLHMQQYFKRYRSKSVFTDDSSFLDVTSSGNNWLDSFCNDYEDRDDYIVATSQSKLPSYEGEVTVKLIVHAYKEDYTPKENTAKTK